MKTLLSLSALLITLTLTAQSRIANWYFNNTSGDGIQSQSSTASGSSSRALGTQTTASGNFSTALGNGAKAMADMATALGHNTTASGDYSTAMGNTTTASGHSSTAMGRGTIASGNYSTAMGYETTASGAASTAMGERTTASGDFSTAMGYRTTASGSRSTAMGGFTTASDWSSLVIGQYNLLGSTVTNSGTQFSTENTAFVIGNGTNWGNRSDALTVLFDGTTTIAGAVTATAFIGDGSQLTNLPSSSPFSFNDTSGDGIQSNNNIASGGFSTAMGNYTIASGNYSTAMGYFTTASEYSSTAMGIETKASGTASTAMGERTTASGDYSTAMGYSTTASGDYSTAMGYSTTASGGYSTAMGWGTIASDNSSLVIGQFNLLGSTVTNSATDFSTENTAFVIGNGTYLGPGQFSRSDALTVLFDGTTTIAGDLSINSDARLKANIISLGSTLAKLLQIDGKTYTMKKDENKKQKIGVLAQDIEKVFPELVSESNGVKSVNYQGLVPVLINALKEQDKKLNKQQVEIDKLKAIVNKLITP
jgi:hypothetical protein